MSWMVCGVGQAHKVVLVLVVRVDAHAQQVGYPVPFWFFLLAGADV